MECKYICYTYTIINVFSLHSIRMIHKYRCIIKWVKCQLNSKVWVVLAGLSLFLLLLKWLKHCGIKQNTFDFLSLYTAALHLHKHIRTKLLVCVVAFISFSACILTETETVMNIEVAFSEQALSYRDNHQRLRVTTSTNSPDDKLPVSHKPVHFLHTLSCKDKAFESLSCPVVQVCINVCIDNLLVVLEQWLPERVQ